MTLAPSNVQAMRQALGQRLREVRQAAGLSGRELARMMERHPSKVSRIENGTTTPTLTDIKLWCIHANATDREDELAAALRTLEGMYVEWGRIEQAGRRQIQESFVDLFHRTQKFRAYSSWLIPGPIQTPAYTRTLLNLTAHKRGFPNDTEAILPIREDRNRVLHEGNHTFAFLVEESLLRSGIGGSDVMAGQLGHLLTASTLPNVSLGIVPMRPDRHMWAVEDFWIYDDSRVLVEMVSGHLTFTQPRDIALYVQTFVELADLAIFGANARSMIAAAVEALP